MEYYLICPIGVIGGSQDLLTYASESPLKTGMIVAIPFGKTTKNGVVIKQTTKPAFKTKPVNAVLSEAIPNHLIALAEWISTYYAARLPIVLQMMLPKGIGKTRRSKQHKEQAKVTRAVSKHPLTTDQENAVQKITSSESVTHILHGVTGSGKTRVYQELARSVLADNKSVLVLVPEISLTPQLASEFGQLHNNVMVLHSGLTEAQRHIYWQQLKDSSDPWVIVGPRSALFSPIENFGLIIVDEAHEPSYVQDSQPKYSALRVARRLADLMPSSKLVLGSATPLVSDYFIAKKTGSPIIQLARPTNERSTTIEVVDMRDRATFGTHSLFSKKLLSAMHKSIAQNEQILLFHNRRGTARMSLCSSCGWTAECKVCHIPLRLHHDLGLLRCHVCGRQETLPQTCPQCGSPDIDFQGFGSKRIESEVRKLFPEAAIARFDGDTPADEQLHNRYQELYENKVQIIIGTQGIAKGLDLPHLNTVGIVQADSELFIPDFSSSERSFQLTTQVIGRAGRSGAKSMVIIQTLNPDHPIIEFSKNQDYAGFYSYEIAERKSEHMPPHAHLLKLTTGYSSARSAETAAEKMRTKIKTKHKNVFVRGPSPAFHEHRGKMFYQQLIVTASKRSDLVYIAEQLPQRWQFTLDPINLL